MHRCIIMRSHWLKFFSHALLQSIWFAGSHAPTKQLWQPFLSQSAMHGSHVLACNGVRLTSQLKWRKVSQPDRFIPYIDCAMLSQFFAYCRDSRVGSYNISYRVKLLQLLIYLLLTGNGVWLVSQLSQLKIYLHIMLIAMLSQVCVIIETAE